MKIRSIILGTLSVCVLIGGVGFAAYYTLRGQARPVEVAPVSNMCYDGSWFIFEDSMAGSVTSQASQNVSLDMEYDIDEVFVTEGQTVTEGTPLFSYDMTLEEIELEGNEIELLSLQLQLSREQKELTKYRNMKPTSTAAWQLPSLTLTARAAEQEASVEDAASVDAADIPDASDGSDMSVSVESVEPAGSAERVEEGRYLDSAGTAVEDGGLVIEEIETVGGSSGTEDQVYLRAVGQYEDLMNTLLLFADEDGTLDETREIALALQKAVDFYQEKLANRIEEELKDEDGGTVVEIRYELKRNVRRVLSDEELKELEEYVAQMEVWEDSFAAFYEESSDDGIASETTAEESGEIILETEEKMSEAGADGELIDVESPDLSGQEEDAGETEGADEEDAGQEEDAGETTGDAGQEEDAGETAGDDDTEEAGQEEDAGETAGTDEEDAAGQEETGETVNESDAEDAGREDDVMQEEDAAYLISQFLLMVEDIEQASSADQADLRTALMFYQQNLADAPQIIVEDAESATTIAELLAYQNLREEIISHLKLTEDEESSDADAAELKTAYVRLCIEFCILLLDEEDENFLNELTAVYEAYLALPDNEQRGRLKNRDRLLGLALIYELIDLGTVEEEPETDTSGLDDEWDEFDEDETDDWDDWDDDWDDWDDDWYDDWYDWDDEDYTAEELEEIITELEESVKELELDIRECELTVEQSRRVVDGKVVTSTLNGTVISVGDEDGNYDDEYFVRVASTTGLYAKGVISELQLDTVNVGDEISGITDDGESFSAEIIEVSEYPDVNGSDRVYGSGNTNAAYYTFYAKIDDPDGIEEGYAELTLSTFYSDSQDSIWLDVYMVRTDGAGNNYVYVEGSDGKLEQRFVTTGSTYDDWAIEITAGLHRSDNIAFPYGDDVYVGAPTKEVSSLEALYED